MEIEKLVKDMRFVIGKAMKWPMTGEIMHEYDINSSEILDSPVELDKGRAIATAAKIIADDPALPDKLAVALMQMTGVSGAKPYEVTNE